MWSRFAPVTAIRTMERRCLLSSLRTPVKADELAARFDVAFSVMDATVEEQLAKHPEQDPAVSFATLEVLTISTFEKMLDGVDAIDFGPPKTGSYEELNPTKLVPVHEEMDLIICVSPEAGWRELEAVLAATEERLTVAMYQFTAPHIFEAVSDAVTPKGGRPSWCCTQSRRSLRDRE